MTLVTPSRRSGTRCSATPTALSRPSRQAADRGAGGPADVLARVPDPLGGDRRDLYPIERQGHASRDADGGVRQHAKAAIASLDRLAARHLTLADCPQNDLEAWTAGGQALYRRETGRFIRWAKKQKLTSLDFPATRWGGPSRVIDAEDRWEQGRRLLHDATLNAEVRVAGFLVPFLAQWPSVIGRLTPGHVHTDDQQVRLSLGRTCWSSCPGLSEPVNRFGTLSDENLGCCVLL